MTVVDLRLEQVVAKPVAVSHATFFVFGNPLPVAEADADVDALIRLEQTTPQNAVLLEMVDRCEAPEIPDDDEGCPW